MQIKEMDELIFLWKEYGKCRDKNLSIGAQKLKQQIRKFIKSLPTLDVKAIDEEIKHK